MTIEINADRLVVQRRAGVILLGDSSGPLLTIRLPNDSEPQHSSRAWQFLNDLRTAAEDALNDLPIPGPVQAIKGG